TGRTRRSAGPPTLGSEPTRSQGGTMTTATRDFEHNVTVDPPAEGADRFVAWFEDVDRADVERVGGKGANLGELTRAGFPVPPGFVVTAEAYLHALDVAGVRDA